MAVLIKPVEVTAKLSDDQKEFSFIIKSEENLLIEHVIEAFSKWLEQLEESE